MILLALANYLQGNRMVQRFHADPAIQAVELLLQEQMPGGLPVDALAQVQAPTLPARNVPLSSTQPWTVPVESTSPQVHLLANGKFLTVISNRGGGYSQWQDVALTRWRSDPTLDDWGLWVMSRCGDRRNLVDWPPTHGRTRRAGRSQLCAPSGRISSSPWPLGCADGGHGGARCRCRNSPHYLSQLRRHAATAAPDHLWRGGPGGRCGRFAPSCLCQSLCRE